MTTAIRLSVNQGQTFSLADVAALSIDPVLAKGIVLIAAILSLTLAGVYLFRLTKSTKALCRIKQRAVPCKRPVESKELLRKLKKVRAALLLCEEIELPCAFDRSICFPHQLIDTLSQGEFEAVISHELDHLRWHDGSLRTACYFICSLFWWIPTGGWLKGMEQAQECACDAKIGPLEGARLNLASAIIKIAKYAKDPLPPYPATYFVHKSGVAKRIERLLESPLYQKNWVQWLQIGCVSFLALSFFWGRFWIF